MMLNKTIIYQINLDRRSDRWVECLANHQAMNFSADDIRRVSACADDAFGALGCAKSHVKVLADFFVNETCEYCAVLEDDFDFTITRAELSDRLEAIRANGLDFDVIMLSGAHALSLNVGVPHLEKVMDAQTTCGYIVKRAYIPKLISCFMESANKLAQYRNGSPRKLFVHWFAIDMAWKVLQKQDKWYIFTPVAGLQRASFSDIEGQHVDYTGAFKT